MCVKSKLLVNKWVKCSILSLCFFTVTTYSSGITVVDYLNRSVSIPQPAQRVVALAPHIVENIFSAGADDTLVGVVEYSDFPQRAREITRVGGVSSFSIEKIVSLSPDLVIVWSSAAKGNIVQQLASLNVPLYVDDPRRLVDIARSIRDFGVLTGRLTKSETAVKHYLSEMQRLRHQYKNQRVKDVSIFYEIWNSPLQTVNGEHIISDVMNLCGGKNAFGDAVSLAPKINIETVINRDPDMIIASDINQTKEEWLDYWLQWSNLKAVRHHNLYFINPDLLQRHTVRILIGAEMLCQYVGKAAITVKR